MRPELLKHNVEVKSPANTGKQMTFHFPIIKPQLNQFAINNQIAVVCGLML
jgi:hypothetical protein